VERTSSVIRPRRGAWIGPCALELHPHALAPLTDLPVLEVVSGVHLIADFKLPPGEVVHDYRHGVEWRTSRTKPKRGCLP
jgi:acetoacetate decarboxylase